MQKNTNKEKEKCKNRERQRHAQERRPEDCSSCQKVWWDWYQAVMISMAFVACRAAILMTAWAKVNGAHIHRRACTSACEPRAESPPGSRARHKCVDCIPAQSRSHSIFARARSPIGVAYNLYHLEVTNRHTRSPPASAGPGGDYLLRGEHGIDRCGHRAH